ncbi:hypothetical protein IRJ41_004328 [Triplophysa rosa]|uniref:Uncharacterized protein n=1 Tax=Triplophysa rosa TaxID=992332 RepID=A0A9W7X3K0_TRIRA|nr:hypothetical protein IRJ41_004328 [Triplophysa rosa]
MCALQPLTSVGTAAPSRRVGPQLDSTSWTGGSRGPADKETLRVRDNERPPSKKKETALCKTVAVLSSEMTELKRLLHLLQHPVAPVDPMQDDGAGVDPGQKIDEEYAESLYHSRHAELDVLSTSGKHVDVTIPPSPQEVFAEVLAAEVSSGGSVRSTEHSQATSDDTLAVLRMAVARLGLDTSVQATQPNVFFRQPPVENSFSMPPCNDFVAEFSNALTASGANRRRPKTARILASMAEADFIGVGRTPEVEQPVAALVVSTDEALRGNVRCPSAQCGRTDSLLKKAYDSTAYITRTENTICQLLLTTTSSLESADVDPSVSQFLQTAIMAMGHVTRELGALTATLLAARRQVWLAQARLSEDCKKTLRDLPFVPGYLFGPNIPELLEKRVKLSETTRQLTHAPRSSTFRAPMAQAHRRYVTLEHRFHQEPTPQPRGPQRPRVAEQGRGFRPPHRQLAGQRPPTTTKIRVHRA